MRHTVGKRMLRETGDIKAVSEFLGQSGVPITEHFYLDADTRPQREATERSNEGLRRQGEEFERIMATQQQPAAGTSAASAQSPHITPHSAVAGGRKSFKVRQ